LRQHLSLALLLLTPALAQDAPPPGKSTLQINVRDADINALVRDPSGKLLLNLTRDDFHITEDGKPVPLHYFNNDHDLPLTLGLLVPSPPTTPAFASKPAPAITPHSYFTP